MLKVLQLFVMLKQIYEAKTETIFQNIKTIYELQNNVTNVGKLEIFKNILGFNVLRIVLAYYIVEQTKSLLYSFVPVEQPHLLYIAI